MRAISAVRADETCKSGEDAEGALGRECVRVDWRG